MALPKLNSVPQYSCNIPSTKETVKYRPYLVKEEKILMVDYKLLTLHFFTSFLDMTPMT